MYLVLEVVGLFSVRGVVFLLSLTLIRLLLLVLSLPAHTHTHTHTHTHRCKLLVSLSFLTGSIISLLETAGWMQLTQQKEDTHTHTHTHTHTQTHKHQYEIERYSKTIFFVFAQPPRGWATERSEVRKEGPMAM